MTVPANTHFVVFTTNRSGSVWMMSTLNSFSNVTAQGELFLPRPRVSEQRWDSDIAIPRYIETKKEMRGIRPFSVFSYLQRLYRSPGAVGFKLMYAQLGQYPEILAYLIWHRIRVVHLVRRNHLDVMLSYAIKSKIGKAHILNGQIVPTQISVELDTNSLLNRLNRLQKKQQFARMVLKVCRLPTVEVAYEDLLANPDNFHLVWDFLSLDTANATANSNLQKIRRGGHRQVIRNYDEVQRVLADSRFNLLLER